MKKTILLHLTDFHFGGESSVNAPSSNYSSDDIRKLITELIIENYKQEDFSIVVAVGGDIADRANSLKYQYANNFLCGLKNALSAYEVSFIFCPGNHDIGSNTENPFSDFNNFTRTFLNKSSYVYNSDTTAVLEEINDYSFLSINSSYRGNRKYGEIDLKRLKEVLKLTKNHIIILTHHHLIPIEYEDVSTTRNAYPFFHLVSKYETKCILHGHMHSSNSFKINNIPVFGTGALFPNVGSGNNNQFRIVALPQGLDELSTTVYRITFDPENSSEISLVKS